MARAKFDDNQVPTLIAVLDSDGETPVRLEANAAGELLTAATVTIAANSSVNLNQIAGNAVSAGNGTSGTGTLRVTVASDSTGVLGATQSGTWNITNISGTISLPTGAATAANQSTANTSLATIAGAVSGTEMQVDVLTMPTVTVQATNLDIRDIDKASDDILVYANTAKDGTGTSYVPLVDADGHLQIDVLTGGGGGTQYTEDAVAAADPVGTALNLIRKDTLAGLTSADGDNVAARGTDKGELYVKHADAITANAGTNLNTSALALETGGNLAGAATSLAIMDDWDNAASDGASVSGDVAHDTVDAGEPVKIGFKAYSPDGTTPGTAVAELDRTNAKADLDGRQFVNSEHPRWWSYHSDGSSALTDASVQSAPGAGFQIVITEIIFSTGAATACNIFFEEGATKILGPWYLEAVAGRGVVWRGNKHVTANTALTVTTSAAIAQSVDVQGYIQAV